MARKGESEWIEVSRRRKSGVNSYPRWDMANGGRGGGRGMAPTTTFFITEFPEKYGAKDLYNIFKKFGDIDEVILPSRRDKRGKRFGFARFFNVSDERVLAVKLDNIIIESRKLHANLPRFNRERVGGVERGAIHQNQGRIGRTMGGRGEVKTSIQNGRRNMGELNNPGPHGGVLRKSYVQTVKVDQGRQLVVDGQLHSKKIPFAHLEYNVKEEDLIRFQKAYVGVMETPGETSNMQERFNKEGYFGVRVTPLGANFCLLEEGEEGILKDIIAEAPVWIHKWFDEIRPWRPNEVDNERVTWLRVYGLPCHAWQDKVFDFITTSVGVFICADDDTIKQRSFDVARILIRTKYCLVLNETYNISINDNVFRIKVVEDNHGPLRISLNHGGKCSDLPGECSDDDIDSWSNKDS
ncbi:uncharacterized protein LOC131657654 [Vicia villosa]|uniref:uncharacterized protein LOC131657654 n=1 Tax=Vicia villosa TaxID=3911 RepID=UPI00273AD487|nr:uncharacterized protein LOC131657654 [Vicia villosa]